MATAMCVSLAGCGNQSATGTATASGTDNAEAAGEEPYEATVMYWAANDARDVQHVEDAINELSIPAINVEIHLQPVTIGTYMQQIQMVLSSDSDLDIVPLFGTNAGSYIDAGYLVDMIPSDRISLRLSDRKILTVERLAISFGEFPPCMREAHRSDMW